MINIRKYEFPKCAVFYKDEQIGVIENEHELYMFRTDIIGDPEYNLYYIITPLGEKLVFDEFGIHPYSEEVEYVNIILREIIDKQMSYRIKKEEEKKVAGV